MWSVQIKVIPVKIGANQTISKSFWIYWATYVKGMVSRNYRQQSFWALHTYVL